MQKHDLLWRRMMKPGVRTVSALFGLMVLTTPLGGRVAHAGVASLKGILVPEPANLGQFVSDKQAAIQLGKALFWDVQLSSDGKTACATCHFQGGADSRTKNQLAPGGQLAVTDPNFDANFSTKDLGFGPNIDLTASAFPFTRHALDPNNPAAPISSDTNDVASSQGVFKAKFVGITPGSPVDQCTAANDTIFHVEAVNVRQVSRRNTPTIINAIFNFRSFWDGRARETFNGINNQGVVGLSTPVPTVLMANAPADAPQPVTLTGALQLDSSSLASQAVLPSTNATVQSCAGRKWAHIAQKLTDPALVPLGQQHVASTDSALGRPLALPGSGLSVGYADLIRQAFQPSWWQSTVGVTQDGIAGLTQMQANFRLFFGLAVQLYEATLIADDTPFDRFMVGQGALTASQLNGLSVFGGKGRCTQCHDRAELTNASVRQAAGGKKVAKGFANIGARPAADDLGFNAAGGKFKIPGLRNVELTGPYFHNGGKATLRQVVQFYSRGGDFRSAAIDKKLRILNLTEAEQSDLVSFLLALTDDRVRFQQAPFDHPQLVVPNGQNPGGFDIPVELPAVGAAGDVLHPLQPFLGLDPQTPE